MENTEENSEKIGKIKKKSRLNNEMIWKLWKKSKLNSEKIWKIQKKSKLNSEKIGTILKKDKLNSEMIWKIQKKIVKIYEKYGRKVFFFNKTINTACNLFKFTLCPTVKGNNSVYEGINL